MIKTIYEGRPWDLYSPGTFYSFLTNFPGAEFIMAGENGKDKLFSFHISPQEVSLRYEGNHEDARVTAFGNEPQINDIENILKEAGEKYERKRDASAI